MGSKFCMNLACRTTSTHEWKKGWPLRSGGLADLCYKCGFAYENSVYCDMFHLPESGWRECAMCRKKIHCGCIASVNIFENLDFGGIGCIACIKNPQRNLIQSGQNCSNGFSALTLNNMGCPRPPFVENTLVNTRTDDGKFVQLCNIAEVDGSSLMSQSQGGDVLASGRKINGDAVSPAEDVRKGFFGATQRSGVTPQFSRLENDRLKVEFKDMHDSVAQPSLSIGLGTSSRPPSFLQSSVEVKEESKVPSSFQQGQRSRPILPKPPKAGSATNSDTNRSTTSNIRIARPPAEGRGKNQLLPRYWPRITDQELQQLSGDLNSTIVPLFEKVLSASDAGRIGRLVLPKACAEAYFPPISQSEGVPVKIQDVKGKEWTFQFRFWPNNNSRMYVLEGVTPCIQSMQLQAGDTVIFSRLDPGGKLVMGFRKSSNSTDVQDSQTGALPSGSKDPHPNALPERTSSADGGDLWHRSDNNGNRMSEDSRPQSVPNSEKKRTRNIGPKNKRLLMNSEEALELRLTWEEAQDLLRPPPSASPSIVIVEDFEVEEYDEPPVFGKRTIFTALPSGGQEQWAQCDDCSKWRRLPFDVLLPPKWTCAENVWDLSRCSCSAPDELGPKELDQLVKVNKDMKKRKIMDKANQDREPSGLHALASAAVLGESMGDAGEPSVGATTKHPRHRPGCTCIVCIQPPSGKGKHKPTCICNVCLTVKRRFKTLMLRKKKRQEAEEMAQKEQNGKDESGQKDENEREEAAQKDPNEMDDSETNEASNPPPLNQPQIDSTQDMIQPEVLESSSGQIDLNCHPERNEVHAAPEDRGSNASAASTTSLVQAATVPLENYSQQNGSSSLRDGEQVSLSPGVLPTSPGVLPTSGEAGKEQPVEGPSSSTASEHETKIEEENCEPEVKVT